MAVKCLNDCVADIADENILSSRSVPDSLQKEKSENEIKKQQQNREKKSEDNKQQNVEQTSLQNREKKNEDKIEKQPNVDQASASQLKYILISCHQDCFIRLWDSKVSLLFTELYSLLTKSYCLLNCTVCLLNLIVY